MKRQIIYAVILVLLVPSCNQRTNKSATKDKDSFSFAFLTDIHVQKQRNADKGLMMAIESVNSREVDFVLTGGDLVFDVLGKGEQDAENLFDLYTEISANFKYPVYNAVGNHEEFGIYEESGVSPDHPLYGDNMFESRIGKRFQTFEHKGWKFYILDSVEDTEERRYIGFVDSVQLNWIKEDLKTVDRETPIVIVTHIPFITANTQLKKGSMAMNSRGLVVENSKEVLDLFGGHNLKLVLQGHLHILEDIFAGGIHFITGGAVCARWWQGPLDGMEEGYLVVHVNGENITWEYVDYGWEV